MTTVELPVRDHTFELNVGTIDIPDWLEITKADKFTHSHSGNDASTTTFDDDGWESHIKISRTNGFGLAGVYKEDISNGDQTEAHEALQAWSNEMGSTSLKQFRITTAGGNTLTFMCSCSYQLPGGGNDDIQKWELDIKVSGAITNSALPAVPGAPTSVAGTTASAHSIITFTAGSGSPTLYEVVAYVSGVEHSRVQGSQTTIRYGGLTNGTAYTFKVRARNTAGWGALSSASSAVTPA